MNYISTPEGTRDLLFTATRALRNTEQCIRATLEKRGYEEIITPVMEYYDVFRHANPAQSQEVMVKASDRNGRICVMRPDNTTPIARVAASRFPDEAFPAHIYYCQNVIRAVADDHGHRGEVLQIGAELIGADGLEADLDILSAAFDALAGAGAGFRIELGHAGIYKGLISSLGVPEETAEEIRRLIETKSFAALGDILEPYRDREAYRALKAMPQLFGGAEVLEEAERLTENTQAVQVHQFCAADVIMHCAENLAAVLRRQVLQLIWRH